ncbi:MAG: metal-dependent phosphohydrolase HD sub domain-containing protein [Candidatus Berkelbacteria bacterium Licking1014_7]|uniref:Metal-dependent phosphohydrolase HD sub domain-containing protein n=1 Tax=Candidatus Berkelbacteria bacterium Licking1014_7 TaxID=2017147 RepID=A0A554LHD3_9BACT|nr:MAG: metal-dependent phosphohydrolase HD sub domain-containing protein [Candidatus Berkelbacteria bacterium Licking1014_7]
MMTKIEQVKNLVKNKFEENDWRYHILPVVKYAKKLARIYKVDMELTELAALLHDIGRVDKKNDENHHIIGISMAEEILKKFNYPDRAIEEVKHVVVSHRTSKGENPKTIIAKIVANADAMAHFDILPVFFWWRKSGKEDRFEDVLQWVENKLKKDWQKKITLPEAKEISKKNYEANKLILGFLNKYAKEKHY